MDGTGTPTAVHGISDCKTGYLNRDFAIPVYLVEDCHMQVAYSSITLDRSLATLIAPIPAASNGSESWISHVGRNGIS